ncbi:MAG: Single-stranded DNA-binding protein [candidate division WS2 bacterium ADurb.Bin280]|uniref:Single-stranded DNA-binding protein n=1 Tax=candidate division WS2 bacterium ADurb.Bin280 TaxID=1852829 RepID=A0A1V5SBT0_9BACT|nr:MAG: Single-stranded DNA-binding protein [candidate division WS2 bacterium ADurb.Bin280]
MLNINRATILGNSTRDVEFRTTPNGRSVASFAVATNRRWNDRETGEAKDEVQYHEVVVWGKLAEIVRQVVSKGTKVYVEGRLQTRSWEGQDGAKREKTEIIAENVISLSPKGSSYTSSDDLGEASQDSASSPKAQKPKGEAKGIEDEINLDEIPF